MNRSFLVVATLAVVPTVGVVTAIMKGQVLVNTEVSFKQHPVRFDESVGGVKPQPKIPANWTLVGVEHGTRINETHLWFQKTTGEVVMLQGFSDPNSREFVLDEYANLIPAEK